MSARADDTVDEPPRDTRRTYAVEELPEHIAFGILALAREAERDGADVDGSESRDSA